MHSKKHGMRATKKHGMRATKKAGPSDWNKKVMKIYYEMKNKDQNVKLGDAMREASKRKKMGKL
jgi:hypothetical protein